MLSQAGAGEVIGETELLHGFGGDVAASCLAYSVVADGDLVALWLPSPRYNACLPARANRSVRLTASESRMHVAPQLLHSPVPSGLRTCSVVGEGSFAKVALCARQDSYPRCVITAHLDLGVITAHLDLGVITAHLDLGGG